MEYVEFWWKNNDDTSFEELNEKKWNQMNFRKFHSVHSMFTKKKLNYLKIELF